MDVGFFADFIEEGRIIHSFIIHIFAYSSPRSRMDVGIFADFIEEGRPRCRESFRDRRRYFTRNPRVNPDMIMKVYKGLFHQGFNNKECCYNCHNNVLNRKTSKNVTRDSYIVLKQLKVEQI